MPRKTVTEMKPLVKKGLRGFEAIWQHVLNADGQFTIKCIHAKTKIKHLQTTRDYIKRLEKAGYVEVIKTDANNANHYKLVRRMKEAPRLKRDGTHVVQGMGRDNMWRTIQMLKSFTAKDLSVHASNEEVEVTENTAADYLKFLERAGYITRKKGGHKTSGKTCYRFIPTQMTGPKAPMIQRIKTVYDPNLKKVVWPTEVTDELA